MPQGEVFPRAHSLVLTYDQRWGRQLALYWRATGVLIAISVGSATISGMRRGGCFCDWCWVHDDWKGDNCFCDRCLVYIDFRRGKGGNYFCDWCWVISGMGKVAVVSPLSTAGERW
ncbi:hypothetical protein B296_00002654 [Ensete ventricosum]|uniref:Uncharacterized protein n=1 Tax=Ensete ventricosum TaxID=4639 RepID=A0A427B6I5_ENSVE|nr:hypothetical protein B296_00002654 [Ensete ventricosum]